VTFTGRIAAGGSYPGNNICNEINYLQSKCVVWCVTCDVYREDWTSGVCGVTFPGFNPGNNMSDVLRLYEENM